MDDLFKFIYIAGIIIYFVYRALAGKNPFKENKPARNQVPKKPFSRSTPSQSYGEKPPKKSAPSVQESIKKLDKEINKSQQKIKTEKHIHSKVYESKRPKAKTYYEILEERSSSSEAKTEDVQDHFSKIQNYNEIKNYEAGFKVEEPLFEYPVDESTIPNPYAQMLKEPDGLKKAIIMKEILDRKY